MEENLTDNHDLWLMSKRNQSGMIIVVAVLSKRTDSFSVHFTELSVVMGFNKKNMGQAAKKLFEEMERTRLLGKIQASAQDSA